MKLSTEGLDLIKEFEGYLDKQPDGSCKAYRCPANVWTCGWGCTEGVGPNTHWTADEATERLAAEMSKHEAAVEKMVKVSITQHQFDALVSFSYNVGAAALGRSTLLKKLNRGDFAGAQAEFIKWNKAAGRQLRGLSRRRAMEEALFAKSDVSTTPMAQSVDAPVAKPGRPTVAVTAATTAAVLVEAAPALPVPAVPEVVTQSISNVQLWKGMGEQIWTLKAFALAQPILAGAVGITVLAVMFWPWRKAQ